MANNIIGGLAQGAAVAGIANQIASVRSELSAVHASVAGVASNQAETTTKLEGFIDEFRTYVEADAKHKELSIAEMRIVKTRQELEKRFGRFDEVRQHATGILRSADVAVVRRETMRTATEELMLACPTYWLAPALVALAAWIGDQQELANRALAEALRRDDYKTSLLFALAARRARKSSAAAVWLDRYFRLQDPYALDREVSVLLDAVALGAFGPEATSVLTSGIDGWLTEVMSQPQFLEEERRRWRQAFFGMKGTLAPTEFTYLPQYSPSWSKLHASLMAVRGHAVALAYLNDTIDGEVVLPPSLEDRIDAILEHLVTDFDDDELDLRRAERRLDLIIKHDGDRVKADHAWNLEESSLKEKSSFVAILTSASLGQGTGTTRATQRLALALSKPWAMEAHDQYVAQLRANRPLDADIKINDWTSVIRSGADEQPLVDKLLVHLDEEERKAMKAASLIATYVWAGLALGAVALHWYVFAIVLAIVAGVAYYMRTLKHTKIAKRFAADRVAGESIVRASVSEYVDYIAAWDLADRGADAVTAKLTGIVPEHFIATPRELRTA